MLSDVRRIMFFCFKQKTAYERRISYWCSDVCSSDLTAEHGSLQLAWRAAQRELGRPFPRAAGIAVASPINDELIKLTNNPWIIRPALINERLEVDDWVLINDFGAVGHAVAQLPDDEFIHLCGQIGRASCRERVCQYV